MCILTADPGANAAPGPRGTFLYAQKGTKNAPAPLRGWTPRLFVYATSCQAKPLTDCYGPLGCGAFEGHLLSRDCRGRSSILPCLLDIPSDYCCYCPAQIVLRWTQRPSTSRSILSQSPDNERRRYVTRRRVTKAEIRLRECRFRKGPSKAGQPNGP